MSKNVGDRVTVGYLDDHDIAEKREDGSLVLRPHIPTFAEKWGTRFCKLVNDHCDFRNELTHYKAECIAEYVKDHLDEIQQEVRPAAAQR